MGWNPVKASSGNIHTGKNFMHVVKLIIESFKISRNRAHIKY